MPQGLVEAVDADQCRLLSALPAPTCASPHLYCVCVLKIFPTIRISIKQITGRTTKAKQVKSLSLSLWDMIISLVHEIFNNNIRKGKEDFFCIFPKHTSRVHGSDLTVNIYTPTSRHRHLMFHCYWFLCPTPQTLLYKCFSKGRTGWNCGSARSHSSQSRFFSAARFSCGTL